MLWNFCFAYKRAIDLYIPFERLLHGRHWIAWEALNRPKIQLWNGFTSIHQNENWLLDGCIERNTQSTTMSLNSTHFRSIQYCQFRMILIFCVRMCVCACGVCSSQIPLEMVCNQGSQYWNDCYHSIAPLYSELRTIRCTMLSWKSEFTEHHHRNEIYSFALRAIKSMESHNRLHNRYHYSWFKVNSHNWIRIEFSWIRRFFFSCYSF